PPQAEVNSILLTIKAAKKTGCRTIIAHVSAPESMKVIKRAQDEGVEIYAETCAHYLSFDKEEMVPFGSYARMKPPFRSRDEVEKMDRLFEADAFSVIGSDHAPFTKEEKEKNGADVWKSVDGLYGLELTLPLLLKLVEEKKADYKQIVRAFSENAAALFNLQGKGRIAEGKDADLVFVEKLDMPETFARKNLLCKCKECAVIYDGISFGHKVRRTILGGRTVYLDGEVILTQGESKLMHY
ncbi:MAG: hypothetical protein EOM18_15995, partial [Clostridia bacterium]|nr:hypothetical protein [Clostridia bacterium]